MCWQPMLCSNAGGEDGTDSTFSEFTRAMRGLLPYITMRDFRLVSDKKVLE